METDIVKEFEDTVKALERLYVKYYGCAMSDEVYDRFATLRDDTLPALRKQLRAAMLSPAATPAAPGEVTTYHRDDVVDEAQGREIWRKLCLGLSDSGRKRLANWVAHGARATRCSEGVILERDDWAKYGDCQFIKAEPAALSNSAHVAAG